MSTPTNGAGCAPGPAFWLKRAEQFHDLARHVREAVSDRENPSFALLYGMRCLYPPECGYIPEVPLGCDGAGAGWAVLRHGLIGWQPFVDREEEARSTAAWAAFREANPQAFSCPPALILTTDPDTGNAGWKPYYGPRIVSEEEMLTTRWEELAAVTMREVPSAWADSFIRPMIRDWWRRQAPEEFGDWLAGLDAAALDHLADDSPQQVMPDLTPWQRWGLLLFALLGDGCGFVRRYPVPIRAMSPQERASGWPKDDPLEAVDWLWDEDGIPQRFGRPPGDPEAVIQWPCAASARLCYRLMRIEMGEAPAAPSASDVAAPSAGRIRRTPVQEAILVALSRCSGPISGRELASAAGYAHGTIRNEVGPLIREKLIYKQCGPRGGYSLNPKRY